MLAIIPAICFVLIFLSVHIRSAQREGPRSCRASLLGAAVVWALVLAAITEILSAFNGITFAWVAGLWGLASVISAFMCFIVIRKSRLVLHFRLPEMHAWGIVPLLGVVFVAAATVLTAMLAPPNTWDSMTYHMGRVVHWMQNCSVAHYPTNIVRQLYMNPWAEFAIMHFQILSQGDRFANLVQWFSMVGSVLGVTLIAEQLGANGRGRLLAAVICVTIPMGVLQASSTQNDYVVSFWLVCCVYYLILSKTETNWVYPLAAGASLGLAVLTKAVAYLYAPPFLVWFAVSEVKAHGRRLWKSALVIASVTFLINLGHYGRNCRLFGHPLGPPAEVRMFSTKILSARALVSNALRNLSFHIATPFSRPNRAVERALGSLHSSLGIDVNDPRTTWGLVRFCIVRTSYNENYDGNPIHLVLIVMSIAIVVLSRRLRQLQNLLPYLICLVCAFLLFNLYLKWTAWNSRLHLPLFILASPLIAASMSVTLNRGVVNGIVLVLILWALPYVFFNRYRPLVGKNTVFNTSRLDQYFTNRPQWREPYEAAVQFLISRECREVGLSVGRHDWEYPFWVLLKENAGRPVRLEHVNVDNASAEKYNAPPFAGFTPGDIISVGAGERGELVNCNSVYEKARSWGRVSVFCRQ